MDLDDKDISVPIIEPEENQTQTNFKCPCVPLIPCLGIVANYVLCLCGVSKLEWVMFLFFELTGALFYFLYGYNNSLMPAKVKRHQNSRHSLEYSNVNASALN